MRAFLLILAATGVLATPALAQTPMPAPAAPAPAPGVEYLVGDWRITGEDPVTRGTFTADYRVEQFPGSPWISGQGLSADRTINARDVWGRDPLTGEIIRVVFDASGATGTVRSPGWAGDTLVLEGEIRSKGGAQRLRQSITKQGPDQFRAVWEAFRNGKWQAYAVETVTRRT